MSVIDVGPSFSTSHAGWTGNDLVVSVANPANDTGTINYIKFLSGPYSGHSKFVSVAVSGSNVTSDAYTGSINYASGYTLYEFNAPGDFTAFNINYGECIGVYNASGYGTVSWSLISGGGGVLYKAASALPWSSVSCSSQSAFDVGVYATGTTSSGGTNALVDQSGAYGSLAFTVGTQTVVTTRLGSVTQSGQTLNLTGGTQVTSATQIGTVTVPQLSTNLTLAKGTQVVATVRNATVAQIGASLTLSKGTQVIATKQISTVTQVHGTLSLSGGTQAVSTGSIVPASVTQIGKALTLSGGTQAVAAVRKASVTQVGATLTFTKGTQSIVGESFASVTQTHGTMTFTGGTQTVIANVATITGYKYDSTNHWITFMVNGTEVARLKQNGDLDLHGVANNNAF